MREEVNTYNIKKTYISVELKVKSVNVLLDCEANQLKVVKGG